METEFDVVILGSGPAGLQAAVHAARTRARVAVLGKVQSSALYKAHVENYCCMNETVSGEAILNAGKNQAEKFGASPPRFGRSPSRTRRLADSVSNSNREIPFLPGQ